jgi:hypothetical protein
MQKNRLKAELRTKAGSNSRGSEFRHQAVGRLKRERLEKSQQFS